MLLRCCSLLRPCEGQLSGQQTNVILPSLLCMMQDKVLGTRKRIRAYAG